MAVFGLSQAHEDDPVRAVRAAQEIHKCVEKISPEVEQRIGRALVSHTGINTGLVVTGKMDSEKGIMGVVGDTVNVAARLSDLADAGEILIGPETQAGLPEGQYTWLTSHAHEHAQGIPYYPVIDLLNRAWGIVEDDTPSRVREKIETGIRSLLQDPNAAIPYVGNLYALDYPELRGISPEYWARRLYEASLAIFEAMAVASPMVFCFEDLHWADPSTMELLRHVLTHLRRPAVTLCTYRPPFRLFA